MPQPRPVVLHYQNSAAFGPVPKKVRVAANDTVHFQIGPATRAQVPGCRLRITLHDAEHFSPGVLEHASSAVNAQELVLSVLPGVAAGPDGVITGYKCELLDANGVPIPGLVSDGSTGGDIVPDTGAA
jgi:hypothetical protein